MIPPAGFNPAGTVEFARLVRTDPPFIRKRKYTGRRAAGVVYEKKAQKHLEFLYPDTYIPSPWLYFRSKGSDKHRWCQPDGLNIDVVAGIVTCVEIKSSHTSDAWWQTRKLYIPVLQHIFKPELWELQVCEICKWFDPAVHFPEKTQLTTEVHRPSKKFKVHIWHP